MGEEIKIGLYSDMGGEVETVLRDADGNHLASVRHNEPTGMITSLVLSVPKQEEQAEEPPIDNSLDKG